MDETFFKLDTLCAHEKPDKNTKKVMKKKIDFNC